jgi:hypothetical protein
MKARAIRRYDAVPARCRIDYAPGCRLGSANRADSLPALANIVGFVGIHLDGVVRTTVPQLVGIIGF